VSTTIDFRPERGRKELRFSRADLGKPLGDRLDGTVILDQRACFPGGGTLRHISLIRQKLSYRRHTLSGCGALQLALEPASQPLIARLKHGHRGGSTLALDNVVQQLGECGLVAPWKECHAGGTQSIRERRRSHSMMLPLIFDEGLALQLFQVVPDAVE
jgi:hypothetical protein